MGSWLRRLTMAAPIAAAGLLVAPGHAVATSQTAMDLPIPISVDPSHAHGTVTASVGGPNGSGTVTTNFTSEAWSATLNIDLPQWVTGTAGLSGGQLSVDASAKVPGATLIVKGVVGQDLAVTLKPDVLNGGHSSLAPRLMANVAPDVPLAASSPQSEALDAFASWIKKTAGFVLLALLLILILPSVNGGLRVMASSPPWRELGLGFVLLLIVPLAAVLVFALGLPTGLWWLGLVLVGLYVVSLLAGFVFAGMVLGRWGLDRVGMTGWHPIFAAVLGLTFLALITSFPYVGGVATVLAIVYGLGALVMWPRSTGREVPVATEALAPSTVAAMATPGVPPPLAVADSEGPAATTAMPREPSPGTAQPPAKAPEEEAMVIGESLPAAEGEEDPSRAEDRRRGARAKPGRPSPA